MSDVSMIFHENQDLFVSLSSLVKRNDGLFKSPAQAKFILSKATDNKINISGMYESNGFAVAPFEYEFTVDNYGVTNVEKWKFGQNRNEAKKVIGYFRRSSEITFTRNVEISVDIRTMFDAALAEKKEVITSKHIGEVGSQITFEGQVIFAKDEMNRYGKREFFFMFRTTDGNIVYWTTTIKTGMERGDRVIITGGVKAHKENARQEEITVVSRAKWQVIGKGE